MICKWIVFKTRGDAAAEFAAALSALSPAAFDEDGCLGYEAFDLGQGVFAVLESWCSEAAAEAHHQAPHTREFKVALSRLNVVREDFSLHPLGH